MLEFHFLYGWSIIFVPVNVLNLIILLNVTLERLLTWYRCFRW